MRQRVVQVRRSVVMIILVIQFGLLAALFGGFVDLRRLHEVDQRTDYQVCVGANDRIRRAIEAFTAPVTVPPNATKEEAEAVRERNERAVRSREAFELALKASDHECQIYLEPEG